MNKIVKIAGVSFALFLAAMMVMPTASVVVAESPQNEEIHTDSNRYAFMGAPSTNEIHSGDGNCIILVEPNTEIHVVIERYMGENDVDAPAQYRLQRYIATLIDGVIVYTPDGLPLMIDAWDAGTIIDSWDAGTIIDAWDAGTIIDAWVGTDIISAWDSGTVIDSWDAGTIIDGWDGTIIIND